MKLYGSSSLQASKTSIEESVGENMKGLKLTKIQVLLQRVHSVSLGPYSHYSSFRTCQRLGRIYVRYDGDLYLKSLQNGALSLWEECALARSKWTACSIEAWVATTLGLLSRCSHEIQVTDMSLLRRNYP